MKALPRLTVPGSVGTAALCCALLQANPASADLFTSYGGGVFVGYEGGRFMWGVEALASHVVDDNTRCENKPRYAWGPLARFSLYGASQPSFTLTAFAGQEITRSKLGFGVEAGATLAFPDGVENDAAMSIHTGLFGEAMLFNAAFWQEWLLKEYPLAAGARFMPTFGPPHECLLVSGRPQRDADGRKTPAQSVAADGSESPGVLDALAADWLDNARAEYESVPAFLQLAHELAAAGAPAALVGRARAAAVEELEHTELCLGVAGTRASLASLPVPKIVRRDALVGEDALRRLALESWIDGCLGEGLAASLAAAESRSHIVAGVRQVQSRIAYDEQRHAELGWDILRWCIATQPRVKRLLQETRDASLVPAPVRVGDHEQRAAIASRHRRSCVRRLDLLLSA